MCISWMTYQSVLWSICFVNQIRIKDLEKRQKKTQLPTGGQYALVKRYAQYTQT